MVICFAESFLLLLIYLHKNFGDFEKYKLQHHKIYYSNVSSCGLKTKKMNLKMSGCINVF